jgi:hypothetical protein
MIQKDRIKEMEYWTSVVVKQAQKDKRLKRGIVAANNHYAGFGSGTANMFRKMLGMAEAEYGDKVLYKDEKQATLSDF